MKALSCILLFLSLLATGRQAGAQFLGWEQETMHPYYYQPGRFQFGDQPYGCAPFRDRFVVPVMGYCPYYNPRRALQEYCYLHVFDYDGNLYRVDTVRGQVEYGLAYAYTDSTYLLRLNYDFGNNQSPRYDTGQNGGFIFEERTLSGRVLWRRSYLNETSSYGVDIFIRPSGKGFSQLTFVNQDGRGQDSLMYQFYDRQGRFRTQTTVNGLRLSGNGINLPNPERLVSVRYTELTPPDILYTVAHFDTAMRLVREDTIGVLPFIVYNQEIFARPGGGYEVVMTNFRDTTRTRVFGFEANGTQSYMRLIDSVGSLSLLPFADGGRLVTGFRDPFSNIRRINDSIAQARWAEPSVFFMARYDRNWNLLWSLPQTTEDDTIRYRYGPAASIPTSPDDAILLGYKQVSTLVTSQPAGQYGYIARINGIGQIFDPLSVKNTSGPRETQPVLSLYPNPATQGQALHLALPEGWHRARVMILDAQGRLMQEMPYAETISLHGLAAGVYQVSVLSDKGVRRGRVVVQ